MLQFVQYWFLTDSGSFSVRQYPSSCVSLFKNAHVYHRNKTSQCFVHNFRFVVPTGISTLYYMTVYMRRYTQLS